MKAYITLSPNISVKCDRMFGVIGFNENLVKYTPKQILDDCKGMRDLYIKEYKNFWIYPENGE